MRKTVKPGWLVLAAIAMGIVAAGSAVQASDPKAASEASRFSEVLALVKAMPPTKIFYAGHASKEISADAFCRRLLMDLNEPGAFTPLEPFAVLNHPYPSTIPTTSSMTKVAELAADRASERKLGAAVARRVNYCVTDSPNDEARFDGFDKFVGAPPYRIYALPPVLRSPGRAELIYWSERDEAFKSGRSGYAVVALDDCVHKGGVGALTRYRVGRKDPASLRSALAMRGQSVVAWDVAPGIAVAAEVLGRRAGRLWGPTAQCHWEATASQPMPR